MVSDGRSHQEGTALKPEYPQYVNLQDSMPVT